MQGFHVSFLDFPSTVLKRAGFRIENAGADVQRAMASEILQDPCCHDQRTYRALSESYSTYRDFSYDHEGRFLRSRNCVALLVFGVGHHGESRNEYVAREDLSILQLTNMILYWNQKSMMIPIENETAAGWHGWHDPCGCLPALGYPIYGFQPMDYDFLINALVEGLSHQQFFVDLSSSRQISAWLRFPSKDVFDCQVNHLFRKRHDLLADACYFHHFVVDLCASQAIGFGWEIAPYESSACLLLRVLRATEICYEPPICLCCFDSFCAYLGVLFSYCCS
mmetsp:Transcript_35315/g.73524  ORF Transcript_35315/g.73524 Transcript_35315/m.73524 type:complete len:280 (+) Transcript_35315:558-1397(+)